MERRVIIIAGPTASGKSDIAFTLAKTLSTEIISADSRQIYRKLDIGAAKPPDEYLTAVRHHFINSHDLNQPFDAGAFEVEALKIIDEMHSKGLIPIVCGGSGLYIRALINGIIDIAPDESIRSELKAKRDELGDEALYDLLKSIDPLAAASMTSRNYKRVLRALEVYYITGKPISEVHSTFQRGSEIEFMEYGITWDREILYSRINERVERMLEAGLVQEVQGILDDGYPPALNGLNTVGYKEIISYLYNEISLERAVALIQRNTRHYAKRQLTWFKKDPAIQWLKMELSGSASDISGKIYADIVNWGR